MKILVAGGAGFVGCHLCEVLVKNGDEVICMDNLITGKRENIKPLEGRNNFRFVKQDITQKPIKITGKIDQIYHLASPASPNAQSPTSYHALAFETMLVNTVGTWNLAEIAVKNKAKMLFASTSETYGDPLEHPQKETYRGNVSTTGPRSVYDEAKRFGETIMAAFVRSRGLDGRIVRIFNTYGPKMDKDDGRVVTEFFKAAENNLPLPIFGDGMQTRSFCYVDDLVAGLVLAMNKPQTKGEVINLGNPGEFTIRQLAELIIKITGTKSGITKAGDLPEDDPLKRRPDITKARKLLGWEPKIRLEEGLAKMR